MKIFCDEKILADKVNAADSFLKRFIGLMGKKQLPEGGGLLLNCSSIHCFFMKMTIDAVYISKNMTVIGHETIKPWHIGAFFRGAKYVLELPDGCSAEVSPGAKIRIE